jgi:hypothetical protein
MRLVLQLQHRWALSKLKGKCPLLLSTSTLTLVSLLLASENNCRMVEWYDGTCNSNCLSGLTTLYSKLLASIIIIVSSWLKHFSSWPFLSLNWNYFFKNRYFSIHFLILMQVFAWSYSFILFLPFIFNKLITYIYSKVVIEFISSKLPIHFKKYSEF